MKLTWYGHSAFRVDLDGAAILIDPFFTGNPAFEGDGLFAKAHAALPLDLPPGEVGPEAWQIGRVEGESCLHRGEVGAVKAVGQRPFTGEKEPVAAGG